MKRIHWMRLLFWIPLAIGLTGCGPPPEVPPPTPSSPPTQPGAVSPTPTFPVRQPLLVEPFDAPPQDWELTQTNGDANLFHATTGNGRWNFLLEGPYIYLYALYEPAVFKDVRLDVQVFNRGANHNFTTLLCRFDLRFGWYEFNLSNEGTYHILYAQWDGPNKQVLYSSLTDGTSDLIRSDENTFSAICAGNLLTLLVNGKQVASVIDEEHSLTEGQVGIGVSSFEELPVHLEFDSVLISQPD